MAQAVTLGRRPLHPAWIVAGVAFLALICAAGFRAAPGVLMIPLQDEFGWSRGTLSTAVGINLILYGLVSPFAAALMDRFGIRAITATALCLIATGAGLPVLMDHSYQLMLTWGVLIGTGTGSMSMVFAATIANRWFVKRRGLILGVLTAGGATGQLVFLPVIAAVADAIGWRAASLVIAGGALAVVPLVLIVLRDHPQERGVNAYGDPSPQLLPPASAVAGGAAKRAIDALRMAARTPTFWALAVGFGICGASTNGLIGTHFVPAAHDHGMHQTTAAGLLAVVGIFDIVGTIASGYLTDKVDPRLLLGGYYLFRGVGLALLPALLNDSVHPSMIAFIVIYGLDWVATVPPTVVLCRQAFGDQGAIVFGWVFASHQIGAALAAVGAGAIRDHTGSYTGAWFGAAGLCLIAAVVSWSIGRQPRAVRSRGPLVAQAPVFGGAVHAAELSGTQPCLFCGNSDWRFSYSLRAAITPGPWALPRVTVACGACGDAVAAGRRDVLLARLGADFPRDAEAILAVFETQAYAARERIADLARPGG